jgi:hypothetical protein
MVDVTVDEDADMLLWNVAHGLIGKIDIALPGHERQDRAIRGRILEAADLGAFREDFVYANVSWLLAPALEVSAIEGELQAGHMTDEVGAMVGAEVMELVRANLID